MAKKAKQIPVFIEEGPTIFMAAPITFIKRRDKDGIEKWFWKQELLAAMKAPRIS